jgi:hypothetical protein
MLIGYVSDEYHYALADVLLEFERDGASVCVVRSTPRGAVYAELEPGAYRITLSRDGYGAKRVEATIRPDHPHRFRLLSDGLLGYLWPKWVRSGESAEYRIHSAEECRVSLWRYGVRKERVRLISWHGEHSPRAGIQITPDGDYTQSGVDWNRVGYANRTHGQRIVAPERSGLYYLHLESPSGAFFSAPWVVAPARPTAKVAVLASTNTWNAYNNFGGRSNYINPDELPLEPASNIRQENDRYLVGEIDHFFRFEDHEYMPLSFERPEPFNHVPRDVEVTDPIAGRNESHLAPAEWRLLGWLEREGFAYDLYADHQLHSGALDLDAYEVLILNTHPEYWSKEMYLAVKAWVFERGGRLMYLGGDGIDGPIEYDDDGALRCLNRWENIDMSGEKRPGTYEVRFHRHLESPANLLGVCAVAGIMTSAPYRAVDTSHWAFEGTGLEDGDLFGFESLQERCSGGAAGHETDMMSLSSPPGTRLLAKGTTAESGAEMVAFDTDSGGGVFSVGAVTYPASLLIDDVVSKITRNVLERFSTRPGHGEPT